MNPIILYKSLLASYGATANNTDAGFDVANLTDGRPFTWFKSTRLSAEQTIITIDAGAAAAADALAMARHNLGTIAAQVAVQSSPTGAFAGEETERLAAFTPADDAPLLKLFTQASVRYWRIVITHSADSTAALAVLMLGARLAFPFPPETPYTPLIEEQVFDASTSRDGMPLGQALRYTKISVKAAFKNPARTFVFGEYQDFWQDHARPRLPFFYAWDLDTFPEHVFLLKHAGGHSTPISVVTRVDQLDLPMEGLLL